MSIRVLSVIVLCAMIAQPAQASILNLLFPSIQPKAPGPEETLEAPFTDIPLEQLEQTTLGSLYYDLDGAESLSVSHRIAVDIGDWLNNAVVEALSLEPGAPYDAEAHFAPFGQQQYEQFLQESNINQALETNRYRMSSYIEGEPLLLNQGNIEGRYRWLFRVPAVFSFIERRAEGYQGVKAINQRAVLEVQVGRAEDAGGDHNVWIERWSGKVTPME